MTTILSRAGVLALAAAALLWPLFASETAHFYGSLSAIYALVGLSLVILVGWTGQISLGHAAFLGFGCYVGAKFLNQGIPLELAVVLIGMVGAGISLILGVPSLRLRGVYLTIATLAFGLACQRFFFTRPQLRGTSAEEVPRESLLGISTSTDRGLYYAVLVVLALALLLAWNTRRSDVGRVLFAIRDSEQAAAAMAIKIAPYKVGVFAASAALATIAGLFYGMLFRATPGPDQFGVLQSLFYLAMPVLGGAEALLGAVVGGVFLATGQPMVNEFDVRLYLVTSIVLLLVLLSGQDGVMGMMRSARRAVADALRGGPVRYGSFLPENVTDGAVEPAPAVRVTVTEPVPVDARFRMRLRAAGEVTLMSGHLIAQGITKRYAGLVACDSVDLEVAPGEIVGLIGPNGAGKTTTFNCLTGAVKLTAGRITLNGKDISDLPASERARLGIARTFQQAQLFKHLSVEENLLLGRHRNYGAGAVRGALGLARGAERSARKNARAIAEQCGLTPVLDAPVGDLPYGTQRMVEVARAIVLDPEVLLVDEPAAGMDSRESEYFGQVLARISRERTMSVLIIEHDVAMVLSICDRVYVLNFGKLLAAGTPAEIRANSEVRAAYLGSTAHDHRTEVPA